MPQQALIVGLGQFGMSIAESLSEKGIEVLAVDLDKDLVDLASNVGIESIQLDATDELALAKTLPRQRDFAVCTIGDGSKENSIICTALLRQMGVKRIIARACNTIHARILSLVGAHLVVNPEKEFGTRLSSRLVYEKVISEMPLGSGLFITEIKLPEEFVGLNLEQLALTRKYEMTVIALRCSETNVISFPDPKAPLQGNYNLIVVSRQDAIMKLMEKNK